MVVCNQIIQDVQAGGEIPETPLLEEALSSAAEHWGREYRIVRPDGGRRWLTEDHVIIRGPGGAATRLIGAKQDVTVRKEAEEQLRRALGEKETLIREIHHRVKNNLNTISNLIYFQTKLLKDRQAVAAFRDSQNRIQSMARIHEHLYRSWDLATVDMKTCISCGKCAQECPVACIGDFRSLRREAKKRTPAAAEAA